MARRTGVDATTLDFITFGPGEVYIDYGQAGERKLGATDGGTDWNVDRTIREIAVDGVIAAVKGLERVEWVEGTLTVNLKDITAADVKLAVAGGDLDANNPVGWDRITGAEIAAADYLENIALICEHSSLGNDVIFFLDNPTANSPLKATMNDKGEWVLPITFKAHVDGATPNTEPWHVDYPLA